MDRAQWLECTVWTCEVGDDQMLDEHSSLQHFESNQIILFDFYLGLPDLNAFDCDYVHS